MIYYIILLVISTVVVFLPLKRLLILKKIFPSVVLAVTVGLGVFGVCDKIANNPKAIPVEIIAMNEKNENSGGNDVYFRGASVDGKWYHATELCPKSSWLVKDYVLGWRNYDQPVGINSSLNFKIKAEKDIQFIFDSNKWQGLVKIKYGEEEIIVDNYEDREETLDKGVSVSVPKDSLPKNITYAVFLVSIISAGLAFVICMYLFKREDKNIELSNISNRELWIDVFKSIAPLIIVLLHCTCGIFTDWFDLNSKSWYNALYVNCFTAFAVPAFFLISGATLLKRETSIKVTLTKKLPKILIPLFFWSLIYILVNIYRFGSDENFITSVIGMIFSARYSHLWFMYTLTGIYLLLPIISFAYHNIDLVFKKYVIILILVVPSILMYAANMFNVDIPLPAFSIVFPELGLFVLGAWLTVGDKKWCENLKLWVVLCIVSLMATIVSEYYICLRDEFANKAIFSYYGNFPTLMFSISAFMIIYSLKEKMKNVPNIVNNIFVNISSVSMGIYFSHMVALIFIGNRYIGSIGFTNNAGSLLQMCFGAVIYFVITAMFCICGSQIPVVGKVFGNKVEFFQSEGTKFTDERKTFFKARELRNKTIETDDFEESVNSHSNTLEKKSIGHSTSIDALRGIATLCIAIFHFEIYFPIIEGGVLNTGYLSVEFFFILSGFFLCNEFVINSKINTFSLIRKKITRMYIPYILGLISLSMLYAIKWHGGNWIEWLRSQTRWLLSIITQILCIQSAGFTALEGYSNINGPSWYVSALLICTLILTILFNIIKNYKLMQWISAIMSFLIYSLLFKYNFSMNPSGVLFGVLPIAIMRGLAGMMLGFVTYEIFLKTANYIGNISYKLISVIEISLLFLFLILMVQRGERVYNYLVMPISAGLIVVMYQSKGLVSQLFKWYPLQFLGKISFSFYIIQSFCSNIFTCFFDNIKQPYVLIFYLIINTVLGYMVYVFVERKAVQILYKGSK